MPRQFALVIPDGVADEPQPALGGRTPLEAAEVPNMDAVAAAGVVGGANHVPDSMPSGSDVGTMSLFGYDPLAFHTGRAPIEAAAQGIALGPDDWAIRCNVVSMTGGNAGNAGGMGEDAVMKSFTAGQIASDDAAFLLERMQAYVDSGAAFEPVPGRFEFVPGVSYRNLLVYRGVAGEPSPFSTETTTDPPHDVTDQAVGPFLPRGPGAEVLRDLMDHSRTICENEPRLSNRETPATNIWLWGEGRAPSLTPFAERFGLRGAVITAVDLLRGLGRLLGWQVVEVEGATGDLDTDYAAKGRRAVELLERGECDFVVVHVEATDEASHEGDVAAKVRAVEEIDRHVVGPLRTYFAGVPDSRLLVCPDHPTFLRTKTHSHGLVPFAIEGAGVAADKAKAYSEPSAAATGRVVDPGCELLPLFFGETVG